MIESAIRGTAGLLVGRKAIKFDAATDEISSVHLADGIITAVLVADGIAGLSQADEGTFTAASTGCDLFVVAVGGIYVDEEEG